MKRFLLLCSWLISHPAFAGNGQWTEFYLQGTLEFANTVEGVTLLLSCPLQGDAMLGQDYGIALIDTMNHRLQPFTLKLNNQTYQGPIQAENSTSTTQLRHVFELIRTTDAIITINGKTVVVPKLGAEQIPNPRDKTFNCQHE